MPLSRHYRTDLLSQRLHPLSTCFYTDTMLMKSKSSRGNICVQVFTDGSFSYVHPMHSKADAHEGLAAFGQDVGVPREMVSDNSKEQTKYGTEFMKLLGQWRTISRSIELLSPWQHLAENVIGILKSKWKRRMVQRNVPASLWDFGFVWEAEIYSCTAKPKGRTGIEVNNNITISEKMLSITRRLQVLSSASNGSLIRESTTTQLNQLTKLILKITFIIYLI